MRFLKYLGIGLAVLVATLYAVGLFLPDDVHVERSVMINASPERVFPYVNDFRRFNEWQPWAQLDPQTQFTHSGPATGVGARMKWSSEHPNVGRGSQEIIESQPNERVVTLLDFGEQGTAKSYLQLNAEGNSTKVTWGFDTDLQGDVVARYLGLMFDSWIGQDYEKGLASLKSLVEGS